MADEEVMKKKKRKIWTRWTSEEENALRNGVQKYVLSNWSCIKNDEELKNILVSRSVINIKDKWRTISTGRLPAKLRRKVRRKGARGTRDREIVSVESPKPLQQVPASPTPRLANPDYLANLDDIANMPIDQIVQFVQSADAQSKRISGEADMLARIAKAKASEAEQEKWRFEMLKNVLASVSRKQGIEISEELQPMKKTKVQEAKGDGLINLGNTCYMNSVIQCLRGIPELQFLLTRYLPVRPNNIDEASHQLTLATRDLFREIDKNIGPVSPIVFLRRLISKFPQFGELNHGELMQQDAEECWSELINNLSECLKSSGSSDVSDPLKPLFGIGLSSRIHCPESGEGSTEKDVVYSLKCYISPEVNQLHEGIRKGLNSEFEKTCPSLGHPATFWKESTINELPRYLKIQFVRLSWNKESNQPHKIVQKVEFPLELNPFEFCSEELRPTDTLQEGLYDLVSVLTHIGQANSGHYVAWVKQDSEWILFDDDLQVPKFEEDITELLEAVVYSYLSVSMLRLLLSVQGCRPANRVLLRLTPSPNLGLTLVFPLMI